MNEYFLNGKSVSFDWITAQAKKANISTDEFIKNKKITQSSSKPKKPGFGDSLTIEDANPLFAVAKEATTEDNKKDKKPKQKSETKSTAELLNLQNLYRPTILGYTPPSLELTITDEVRKSYKERDEKASRDKNTLESKKLDEYKQKLGDNIWFSEEELSTGEGMAFISTISKSDSMLPGEQGPSLPFDPIRDSYITSSESKKFEQEKNNKLSSGTRGSDGRITEMDWSKIQDGEFIVSNLPTLQNEWTVENGKIKQQADTKKGINLNEKASVNGRDFLSAEETALTKNMALLAKAKESGNVKRVDELQATIEKNRDNLALGKKLYDTNTGELLSVKDTRKVIEDQNTKAQQLAEAKPYNALASAQTKTYYELLALSEKALGLKNNIFKAESGLEQLGSYIKDLAFSKEGEGNTGFFDDIKNLEKVVKTGKLPKNINELPGNHPIAIAFNKKLNEYITVTKAIELNADPVTSEKNNKLITFVDDTFKAIGNDGIYSATGMQNRKQAAKAFNEVMESIGFEYKDKEALDAATEDTLLDLSLQGTAHLIPLIASIFVTKKLTGPQLRQAGTMFSSFSAKAFNNSRAAKIATDIFVGGLNEVAVMGAADVILEKTTGAEPVDTTFAASLGMGNVVSGKLIQKMITNKIPYVTPILSKISIKSSFASKIAEVGLGAGAGTAVMAVAEGATLVKDQLLADGKLDQAAEWDNLASTQHLASTFGSLALLGGFAPKKFYEAIKSDIMNIPGVSRESLRAGEALNIEGKVKISNGIDAQERYKAIDDAEKSALTSLKENNKDTTDFEAMANEEVAIKKAANILRGDVDIQAAKLNIKAGTSDFDASDLWVTANKIKYGEKLKGKELDALAKNPMSLIANQLGLKKGTPIYDVLNKYQKACEEWGNYLNDLNIFSGSPERNAILENRMEANDAQGLLNSLTEKAKANPSNEVLMAPAIESAAKKIEALNEKGKELVNQAGVRISRDLSIDIEAARALTRSKGRNTIEYSGDNAYERFQEALNSNKGAKELTDGNNIFGFFDENSNLHINREATTAGNRGGTGSHESTHFVLQNWMKDPKTGFLTDEGVKFIDDWMATLSPKEFEVIDNIVKEGNYAEEFATKNEYYEEYLAAFTEANRTGQIKYNKSNLDGFRSKLEAALKKSGQKNPKVLPGDAGLTEMSNILKSLAESAKEGKASKEAIEFSEKNKSTNAITNAAFSKAKVEEVQKKIDKLESDYDNELIEYDEYEGKIAAYELELEKAKLIPEPKEAEVKKAITPIEDKSKNLENEAKEVIKENKGKIASEKVQAAYNAKGINAAMEIIDLFKPITKALVNKRRDAPGFDPKLLTDEIETGDGGILDLIRKYDPENGTPLAAYINKYLPVRAITASRRVLDKDFSKDVEDQKGLMSTETAEQSFETSVAEKPKYKNLLEQNVVEDAVVESITKKLLTNLRTVKANPNETVSINKTVTPFIAEIKNVMGKQADIDLKTAMGGKKDNQFRSWLLKNKKATLENMTTTWLMGANGTGGIPQAIQKRIGGKWVNYPEWVDKKIDRESVNTDLAGRTSGAELVRRLPNAINNVSDAEYLGQFLEPSGNPIRGRKESIAKATAEEIVFDILAKDFAEEGPLFDALVLNQESKGIEVGDALAIDVLRQVERGNVKYSAKKGSDEKINAAKEELFDFLKKLNANKNEKLKNYILGYTNRNEKEATTDLLLIKYNELAADIENAWGKKLGSQAARKASVAHENTLNRTLQSLKEASNDKIMEAISYVLKAELKSYKTGDGNFVTTNEAYVNTILKPSITRILGAEVTKSLAEGDFLKVVEKQVAGKKRTYISIKGKIFNHYKPISEIKSEFRKAKTEEQAEKSVKEINTEADNSGKYVLDTVEYYKGEKLIEEGEAHIDLLAIDMLGAIRKMYKVGIWVDGLRSKDSRLEHNTTINDLKKELKKFLKDPNYTREQLEDYVSTLRINLLPKVVDDALTASGAKWTGKDRHLNPEALEALMKYRKNVHGIENMYDSVEAFDAALSASKGAKERRLAIQDKKIQKNALSFSKKKKGISVLDFDDTLAKTKSNVLFTMPDGERGKLNAEEFAKLGQEYLDNGASFDFSEFSKVNEGTKGPMFDRAMELANKFGNKDVYVLTARPSDSNIAIQEFLKAQGLDLKLENIIGLGNSAAQAKAEWIKSKAAEGYNDFYFSDDAVQNVKAVKDMLDILDVKSDVQLAQVKFSESLSKDFNKIIEKKFGIEEYKNFSAIVGKRRGAKKGNYRFFVPPSAEDFSGLLYDFMGKGKEGEATKEWFNETLINPYTRGIAALDVAKQSIKTEYRNIIKANKDVAKKLGKKTPDGDFTYDQAVRVYLWQKAGYEVPGLTERDGKKLNALVETNADLLDFATKLSTLSRQEKGWTSPGEYWDTETLLSDLANLTEGSNRKQYLQEFIQNSELIFSEQNMNKVNAALGNKWVEAMEDSLFRMKNGTNRSAGSNRLVNKWNNWVNNSTGAIMFFNRRSATLQLISATNFLNWSDNNPIKAATAFANQPQYWKDFATLFNSAKLKERRSGLKTEVSESEIANAVNGAGNKAKAVMSYLLKIGFTPTQIADSLAIAGGGATFYRNRVNSYKAEYIAEGGELVRKYTDKQAEDKAFEDFSKTSDESQQSSDPSLVSMQQASSLGRLVLAFQNTPQQYMRLTKKAARDLINGRGDWKTNVSKIAYYTAVQNMVFSALQTGLFALLPGFDDDEIEEKALAKNKEEKIARIINSMSDTVLKGSGLYGAIISTLKNVAMEYVKQEEKGFKADQAQTLLQAASISPPIGSKLRKIYSATKTAKFEKDVMDERGFEVMKDGKVNLSPKYALVGNIASGIANIPLDRVYDEVNSISEALDNRNTEWQRIALALGWKTWDVGAENEENEAIKAAGKAKRKQEGIEKGKETRKKTNAKKKAQRSANKVKRRAKVESFTAAEENAYMKMSGPQRKAYWEKFDKENE